jgi:hypothetical protein
LLSLPQQRPRLLQEAVTRGGQRQPMGVMADEKLDPELLL